MSATTVNRQLLLAELVREHQAGLWRYLRFLGAEADEADDLTQETFLAVMRSNFEHRSAPETLGYLRQVARNQLLMYRRRTGREPVVGSLETAEAVWAEVVKDDLSDYLLALESCLESAVDGRARTAVLLRYREGASRERIGAELNVAAEGVKSLLRRARLALRECVERKLRT